MNPDDEEMRKFCDEFYGIKHRRPWVRGPHSDEWRQRMGARAKADIASGKRKVHRGPQSPPVAIVDTDWFKAYSKSLKSIEVPTPDYFGRSDAEVESIYRDCYIVVKQQANSFRWLLSKCEGLEFEDLLSVASETLLRKIKDYDKIGADKFKAKVSLDIKTALHRAWTEEWSAIRIPNTRAWLDRKAGVETPRVSASLNDRVGEDEGEELIELIVEDDEEVQWDGLGDFVERLRIAVGDLPPKLKDVFVLRYGIGGSHEMLICDVASHLGINERTASGRDERATMMVCESLGVPYRKGIFKELFRS